MDKYDSLLLKNQLCFPTYAVANKIVRKYQPLLDKINLTYTQYIVMMVMWEKKTVNENEDYINWNGKAGNVGISGRNYPDGYILEDIIHQYITQMLGYSTAE